MLFEIFTGTPSITPVATPATAFGTVKRPVFLEDGRLKSVWVRDWQLAGAALESKIAAEKTVERAKFFKKNIEIYPKRGIKIESRVTH